MSFTLNRNIGHRGVRLSRRRASPPPHMSSVLGSGGDTNPFEGATSVGGLSFISLPRQPPQPPPPRLTQQPIPFRGSTKPHCAVKPSKIRDAEFGLHDATDNPAMIQVGNSYADLGA